MGDTATRLHEGMRRLTVGCATGCALLAGVGAVQAGTVTQTKDFNASFSAFTDAASEPVALFPGALTATFQPYDSSLGPLQSATVTWTLSYAFSGTSDADNGGSDGGGVSGAFKINNDGYDGDGNGNGNGSPSGQSFTDSFTVGPDPYVFTPAGAGTTYDPDILAILTGASPFSVTWGISGLNENYQYVVSGMATADASVSVVYQNASVPEPATWALLLTGFGAMGVALRRRRNTAPA